MHIHSRYLVALRNSEFFPLILLRLCMWPLKVKYESGSGITKFPRSHRDCYFR